MSGGLTRWVCALGACITLTAHGQTGPAVQYPVANPSQLRYNLSATALGEGWHVIAGAVEDFSVANGCNIINTGVWVGPQSIWVFNTGPSRLYGVQQKALVDQLAAGKPIDKVVALNLHPDYFLGNQAYPAQALVSTAKTLEGMRRESKAYEDNLFKLCGDWMQGTESALPAEPVTLGQLSQASGGRFQWLELEGHTDSDLAVFDSQTGILWAGGLVFYNRVVTVPHARIPAWIKSLKVLKTLNPRVVVPSHGPVHAGSAGIDQTLDYLTWLDGHLTQAARMGLTANEVMEQGVPQRFRTFAAYPAEFNRNVTTLYPQYERAALNP